VQAKEKERKKRDALFGKLGLIYWEIGDNSLMWKATVER